jgi:hypothetical protein
MAEGADRPRARSLAALTAGEEVTITRILGRGARELCRSLGLREGDRLRCRSTDGVHVWIESPRGGVVAMARHWARYIDVEPAPPLPRPRWPTRPGPERRARSPE